MTKKPPKNEQMTKLHLIFSDALVSFIWVWSGSLARFIAYRFLRVGAHNPVALTFKGSLAVVYLLIFAWLRKATRGAYNPLMVLSYGISGSFSGFLFIAFARIPAQVVGSIVASWLIMLTFPKAAHPPILSVDIHQGALIEGVLSFTIVTVSLTLKKRNPHHSARKTWIKSISKVVLHLLGTDVTGGMMNPAAAFGWAYVQGNYNTKEHWHVYWLAPIEAALLGVWTCSLFVKPSKMEPELEAGNTSINQEAFAWNWMDGQREFMTRKPPPSQLFDNVDLNFLNKQPWHKACSQKKRIGTVVSR